MTVRVLEHLGAKIFRGAAERVASLVLRDHFGEAEVSDADVTIHVDKDVLRLDVAIHDVPFMHVVEAEKDLAHVELCQSF